MPALLLSLGKIMLQLGVSYCRIPNRDSIGWGIQTQGFEGESFFKSTSYGVSHAVGSFLEGRRVRRIQVCRGFPTTHLYTTPF